VRDRPRDDRLRVEERSFASRSSSPRPQRDMLPFYHTKEGTPQRFASKVKRGVLFRVSFSGVPEVWGGLGRWVRGDSRL